MNLSGLLGDDEHTAAEGPYNRVMKTRKWLYISSVSAQAFSLDLFKVEQAEELIKFMRLPPWWLATGVMFGLAYLLLQYTFLIVQLSGTYDIIIHERLASRRADEIKKSKDAFEDAEDKMRLYALSWRQDSLAKAMESADEINQKLTDLKTELDEVVGKGKESSVLPQYIREDLDEKRSRRVAELSEKRYILEKNLTSAYADIAQLRDVESDGLYEDDVYQSLQKEAVSTSRTYQDMVRQEPSLRWGYKTVEGCIDAMRVVPPMVVALWSAMQLAGWFRAIS